MTPTCIRCGKPFRKGSSVWVQHFATFGGRTEEGWAVSPWMTYMEHASCWEKYHETVGTVALWRRVVKRCVDKCREAHG